MLVSSKGRYALRLMIYIAAFGEREGRISLRTVAERESISLKYLEQLVRPLLQAGLLTSVRGKGGGYELGRSASEMTAGDILRAAEGDTAAVRGSRAPAAALTCARRCASGPASRPRSTSTSRASPWPTSRACRRSSSSSRAFPRADPGFGPCRSAARGRIGCVLMAQPMCVPCAPGIMGDYDQITDAASSCPDD